MINFAPDTETNLLLATLMNNKQNKKYSNLSMKKFILFFGLALTGLMTSCVDKDEEVDADSRPSFMGGSIYEELSSPTSERLTGTFKTYLRLIDDLGYKAVLSRTGSKTVFPANDEAFARFFQSNKWGVTDYSQLSQSQKKLLLYSSMLDNALLVGMLSNASGSEGTVKGRALKHPTNVSVIDTITFLRGAADMPQNNRFWDKYKNHGIYTVCDNTVPMLVHFTRDHMVANGITTAGEGSDFEIITGSAYDENENTAYVFSNKIVNKGDVTCQNGYIHQLENVLVPPGNLSQLIRENGETNYFSHILDYYCAPYFDAKLTNRYNDLAVAEGRPTIDSIFQIRYMASKSQDDKQNSVDPNGNSIGQNYIAIDPAWNAYYEAGSKGKEPSDDLRELISMFVPTDQAMADYFVTGAGSYLIDLYGKKENTKENLIENLDSLYNQKPNIIRDFIKNLQKNTFANNVPSRFLTIQNDASELMGMNLGMLRQREDGKYDVQIANNGVMYVLNQMIVPDAYQSVLAPASTYPDMSVMSALSTTDDFDLYLLAMKANFAFFTPTDDAFQGGQYYVNPATLGNAQPKAYRFFVEDPEKGTLAADVYNYDKTTHEIGSRIKTITNANIGTIEKTLLDILNRHTIVLKAGETLGANKFYKTKDGGAIRIENGSGKGMKVRTAAQMDGGMDPSTVQEVYNEKNGRAYRIDRVLQSPYNSVSYTLRHAEGSPFEQFYELAAGFETYADELAWAGITDEEDPVSKKSELDRCRIFTAEYAGKTGCCLDENVSMFNTYNYTLYAPDNAAMEKAFAAGLPTWEQIQELYSKYGEISDEPDDEEIADRAKAKKMAYAIRDFVRYHFQNISIFADNTVETGRYQTLLTDSYGLAQEIDIDSASGNGKIVVKDGAGNTHTIDAAARPATTNMMTRELWLNTNATSADAIETSSYCVVHELADYMLANGMQKNWNDIKAMKPAMKHAKAAKR